MPLNLSPAEQIIFSMASAHEQSGARARDSAPFIYIHHLRRYEETFAVISWPALLLELDKWHWSGFTLPA